MLVVLCSNTQASTLSSVLTWLMCLLCLKDLASILHYSRSLCDQLHSSGSNTSDLVFLLLHFCSCCKKELLILWCVNHVRGCNYYTDNIEELKRHQMHCKHRVHWLTVALSTSWLCCVMPLPISWIDSINPTRSINYIYCFNHYNCKYEIMIFNPCKIIDK